MIDPSICRKRLRRYEIESNEPDFSESQKDYYRAVHFKALDLIISSIEKCFDQPGFRTYRKLHKLDIKAARKQNDAEEYDFMCSFYKEDLIPVCLRSYHHSLFSVLSNGMLNVFIGTYSYKIHAPNKVTKKISTPKSPCSITYTCMLG